MTSFPLSRVIDALRRANLLLESRGELPARATGITDDSRTVSPGALFVAVRGSERDGHDYLSQAEQRGASASVVEDGSGTSLPALIVRDGRRAAAVAASAAFGDPARDLRLVAVTGTNGKTTTVGMLRHLLDDDAGRSASIGTLGVLVGSAGEGIEGGAGLTTPGPVELQRVLGVLRDRGVSTIAMEVSSHSLDQRRVDGLTFDVAVFTNLTRDHLDYHGTMDAYFASKARLLEFLRGNAVAVINSDDEAWTRLPSPAKRVTFSERSASADVHAEHVRFTSRGSRWNLRVPRGNAPRDGASLEVRLPLLGDFNVSNALAAAATAHVLGLGAAEIAARLTSLPQIPGRLEIIHERPTVLRDYAHTPDALERALRAVRPFSEGELIVVFGCGGDRDRGKRPEMGRIAEEHADRVIVTSDNPRTEDPERILDEIEAGMRKSHQRIEDRREAIAHVLATSSPRDLIVLAGKGHEMYQVRGTTKLPFDEKEIVRELAGAAT